jgi:hypothetical protein
VASVQPGDVLNNIDITVSQAGGTGGSGAYRVSILRCVVYLRGMRHHHGDKWRGRGMLSMESPLTAV